MDLKNLKKITWFKFRVWPKKESGKFAVLGYIDARDCMDILDKVVWPENRYKKFYTEKGNLFCSVGIKIGDNIVRKDDCWTESNTEQEKGEASDAFKRACVNWGIGRFLYTLPRIYISEVEEKNNKYDITNFVKTKFKSKLSSRYETNNSI